MIDIAVQEKEYSMQKNTSQKKKNYLDFIPVKNPDFPSVADTEGKVTILVENKGFFHYLAQRILHKPRFTQVHLDKMGNYIWPRIDGKTSVLELSAMVKEEFGEEAEPLYNRMVKYIQILESYGFIALAENQDGQTE